MCNEVFVKTKLNPVAAAALVVGAVPSTCLVREREVHRAH